jgi:hypothetical protein
LPITYSSYADSLGTWTYFPMTGTGADQTQLGLMNGEHKTKEIANAQGDGSSPRPRGTPTTLIIEVRRQEMHCEGYCGAMLSALLTAPAPGDGHTHEAHSHAVFNGETLAYWAAINRSRD